MGLGLNPAQVFSSHVTLGKFLNLPSPQFSLLQDGNNGIT